MDSNGHAEHANGVNRHFTGYSVPQETKELFLNGIILNPLIAPTLPSNIEECAEKVHFEGNNKPSIPINWRFAESISSLKGLEAAMINALLRSKYGIEPQKVIVNTDHAQLFIMSALLWTIDPKGEALTTATAKTPEGKAQFEKYFKNWDIHDPAIGFHRQSTTNIYRTRDRKFFHLHGSMNPDPMLKSLGLPSQRDVTKIEESWKPFEEKIAQINSEDLQRLASDEYKQAGTICWTPEEYQNSEHGKANAHVGLYEIHDVPLANQPACWWPDSPETSAQRPLAGLKVLDLTRVIAAPAITRGLAELGASVMRVTAPHLTDFSSLHCDLSWGKWNSHLDFRKEEDCEKLRALVLDADVVVQGYRPGVLDKYGFSQQGFLDLCKGRERGLIVVRENCYGWQGPWSYRSGWQQISDANCGVSMEFGRAMGNDEPVTPVFPNSDYCTGVCGVVAILNALLRRGSSGGSYNIDIALNYYSQWLVNSCGVYPAAVWEELWVRNGKQVFRHNHNMLYTIPRYLQMLHENSGSILFKPEFFEDRHSGAIGKTIRTIAPILKFPDGPVQLKYNVGTRTNGVDKAFWPKNLMTEVVV
ncbi:alpha-methylacyl-CoA racemase [Lepidopterella palustris CBS 459.81]|uniref:Alpha-methylacyl-CoA racemase n=1 Tax=Lepidopterella palustris CBS 459.81 TaxID=1314670 RepID=A0A8E2EKY0_9PEZI|nr:alpha-methylacyl-CoA racemase [Lepidopterella palustris CBS 459.81]